MNKFTSILLCSLPLLGMSSVAMACEPCSDSAQSASVATPQDASAEQDCQGVSGGPLQALRVAQYQQADGTLLVVCSGQGVPAAESAGPPPSFEDLDQGHKGYLTEQDAEAYAPLINDFLYVSHHTRTIHRASYERWASHMN